MYITIRVINAAETAITKVNKRFITESIGIPLKSGKTINDIGIATPKAIIEVKTIKATYALNAIRTPPFFS